MCLCVLALIIDVSNGADNLAQKCGQVVQKVIPCLDFATGKADAPKKECCDATNSIKDTDPECLCYIIQQTHKGSPESKSMGIQEDKLLQLPTVCHVKDANITNCPKLLGLSPSSPDAAIFKNASKINPPASSSSSASSTGTTTPSTPTPSSDSYNLRPVMITEVMMVTLAIVLGAVITISI
ncbi:Bifunctional inhibitor/lipid-transfer protein/seed storage 2S albumin superfamily protein [Trifolium repens]|nr:Bifunctional inhibitor/lipid-transfer protein/seed storage 2S albumin superfamily protein [Trifolium repens]